MKSALDKVGGIIGETIGHGYRDSHPHQIDVLARNDDGLNIVIRDDSSEKIEIPEGVKLANALDLNIYYINLQRQNGAA